jgi:hypothetical protein
MVVAKMETRGPETVVQANRTGGIRGLICGGPRVLGAAQQALVVSIRRLKFNTPDSTDIRIIAIQEHYTSAKIR